MFMNRPSRFVVASLCVATVLATASCASTGGLSGAEPTSAEYSQVTAYNERVKDFSIQGAVVGALGGALAGALIADNNRVVGALAGAAAGGALGAIAGSYIARNQNEAQTEEEKLQATLDGARQELTELRQTRVAAATLVDRRQQELTAQRQAVQSGAANREALQAQIAQAETERDQIETTREITNDFIQVADAQIMQASAEDPRTDELKMVRDELIQERDELDSQIAILAEEIETSQTI